MSCFTCWVFFVVDVHKLLYCLWFQIFADVSARNYVTYTEVKRSSHTLRKFNQDFMYRYRSVPVAVQGGRFLSVWPWSSSPPSSGKMRYICRPHNYKIRKRKERNFIYVSSRSIAGALIGDTRVN